MRRFDPRSVAAPVFWEPNPVVPTELGSNLMVSGAKTLAYVFTLAGLPSAGNFYSLGQLVNGGGASASEVLLSAIGAPYKPYSFICDDATAVSCGSATALAIGKHRLILSYSGGTNISPGSYVCWIDGIAQSVVTSGIMGQTLTDLSAIGARVDSSHSVSAAINGTMQQALAYGRAITGGEFTLLDAWLATQ